MSLSTFPIQRLSTAISVLRVRPFHTDTAEGRTQERYRRATLTTASSILAKMVSVLTLVISVPLTIRYLGNERYGLWMTIASFVTALSFADLGIGNGLLNAISACNGKEDSQSIRGYVSSAFFLLSGIAVAIIAGLLMIYPFVRWQELFNITSADTVRETGPTFLILVLCFAIRLPFGVTERIESGYQEGYIANLWTALGTFMGLIAVLGAVRLRAGLPWLVVALSGGPLLAAAMNTVWLFTCSRPSLLPRLRNVRLINAKALFNTGLIFFVLQVSLTVGFQSDNLVLAHFLGARKVAEYAVATRMFSFVPLFLTMVVTPLWPAYGEAFARGDVLWLKTTLTRSLVLIISLALPINAFLAIAGKSILRLWVGSNISAGPSLLVAIAVSQTLMALASPISVFLNALHVLKVQAVCFSLMAVSNIVVSIYLTKCIGVTGVVWGSIIAQVVFWILPAVCLLPRFLRSLQSAGVDVQAL